MASTKGSPRQKHRNVNLRLLGPGLVTGAADDDPSGIATYSQAGAQFGYGLLWTVFLTTPFMIAIQLVSAQIGRVTGRGLAANVAQFAPRCANPVHTRHPRLPKFIAGSPRRTRRGSAAALRDNAPAAG